MKISNSLAIAALQLVLVPVATSGELSRNWGLFNVEYHSHIDAPKAWKIAAHGKQIKVCVIDTGVDVTHPELQDRICPVVNGDEFGWDYVTNTKNPKDTMGHGTHVAGIVRSVSPTACIIPVKWYSEKQDGTVRIENTVASIYYCVRRGADIINYSGGGDPSAQEKKAIEVAGRAGILFVAAAGNESISLDSPNGVGYYPASYALPNMIAVASSNIRGQILPSSDYGPIVQVAAPGENILSTTPGGRYGYLTGTSQATPFVTGIAAMILSQYPGLTVAQVREIIFSTVDKSIALKGKVSTGGKVNAFKALVKAKKFVVRKIASKVR